MSLGRHVLTEISTILFTVDKVEKCTFGSKFYGGFDELVGKLRFSRRNGGTGHVIDV